MWKALRAIAGVVTEGRTYVILVFASGLEPPPAILRGVGWWKVGKWWDAWVCRWWLRKLSEELDAKVRRTRLERQWRGKVQ
jgi:hypothetical protein